ncbi:MAG: hypothetical protein Fur006_47040 [Coleofasciculaceae cyanobacterium]
MNNTPFRVAAPIALTRETGVAITRAQGQEITSNTNALGLGQSNVSNHLSCLRCCDLVVRQQQGRYVYYQLSDARIAKLLDLADELLADVAQGVDSCSRYDMKERG